MTPTHKNKGARKLPVFALMILVFVGCLWLIFAPSQEAREAKARGAGFNADIPDPRGDGIVGDKKAAYEQEQMRLKQEEQKRTLQDYAYLFGDVDETPEERAAREERQLALAPKPVDYGGGAFHSSASAHAELTGTLGNLFEPPAADPEKEAMQAQIDELKAAATRQQSGSAMDEQVALLEKSFEIASRYNMPNQPAAAPPTDNSIPGRKTIVEAVEQVRESVVSRLSAPVSDAEYLRRFSQPRNSGFRTVGHQESAALKNTIAAVVHGDQTLIDGQGVRLRTIEAMRAGNRLIPPNTLLTGTAAIAGERLEISITSIESDGYIIPVELLIYDGDGQVGIHVPGSMERDAFKEVAGNMGQGLGTTISLSQQSAGEQLLTDLGRGVIQGASQYLSGKVKQVKVRLKSGHKIFLLPQTL